MIPVITTVHGFLVLAAWLLVLYYLIIGAGIEIDEEAQYRYNTVTDYGQEPIPADELAEMLAS